MACITKRRNRWIIDFYDQHGKRRWITLPEGTTKTRGKGRTESYRRSGEQENVPPQRQGPFIFRGGPRMD